MGKNYVTISNNMFDVEIEVIVGHMTATYVGPIKYICLSYIDGNPPSIGWKLGGHY